MERRGLTQRKKKVRSTVEELVDKINRGGWYVSSIYQTDPTDWYASLRPKHDWTMVDGRGKTMREALVKAWNRTKGVMTERDWQRLKKEQGNETASG